MCIKRQTVFLSFNYLSIIILHFLYIFLPIQIIIPIRAAQLIEFLIAITIMDDTIM